jgi:SAM-dependent methyltransferase
MRSVTGKGSATRPVAIPQKAQQSYPPVLEVFFAYPLSMLDHVTMPTLPPDPASQRYLHGHHEAVLRSHRQRTAANSAAYLLPRLRHDARLLDVGCGPGTITVDLAAHVRDGTVVGLDAEPAIVAEAEASLGARGQPNVTFEVGDVYHLAFDDDRFDVVHAHQVLQHLAEPTAALREMRRVCRPGGLVACRDADYGAMFWYPSSGTMTEWQVLYREVARSAGGEPDAGRHLVAWARAADFSLVEASASMWCFTTSEERVWWGELWAERLTRSRFAEQATLQRLAEVADLERLAAGWREWVAEEEGCFFVPHAEVLCTP